MYMLILGSAPPPGHNPQDFLNKFQTKIYSLRKTISLLQEYFPYGPHAPEQFSMLTN